MTKIPEGFPEDLLAVVARVRINEVGDLKAQLFDLSQMATETVKGRDVFLEHVKQLIQDFPEYLASQKEFVDKFPDYAFAMNDFKNTLEEMSAKFTNHYTDEQAIQDIKKFINRFLNSGPPKPPLI